MVEIRRFPKVFGSGVELNLGKDGASLWIMGADDGWFVLGSLQTLNAPRRASQLLYSMHLTTCLP